MKAGLLDERRTVGIGHVSLLFVFIISFSILVVIRIIVTTDISSETDSVYNINFISLSFLSL
jgi:hypothetical protein